MCTQLRLELPGLVFVAQGTCALCGDTIMAGDAHCALLNGDLRCRVCKPSLRDQFVEMIAALRNREHAIWQSDEAIADALIDADALRVALMRADKSIVPASSDLLALLSEAEDLSEKPDLVDDLIVGLAYYLGEI